VDEALRLADKIVIMRSGKVVQYASPIDILSQPADAFVNELVGGDDMVRQLGLVRVESAMSKLPANFHLDGQPTIACDQNLREALSRLLRTNEPALVVLDGERATGLLTLNDIRATTKTTNSTGTNNDVNIFEEVSSLA